MMSHICVIHHSSAHLFCPRSHPCHHSAAVLPHRPHCYILSCLEDILHQDKALMMCEDRGRVKENPIQKLCKCVKTVPDEVRYGSKCNWDPPVFTWWDSHGRAQSKNSSWSIATSPLWPWERCE